MFSLSTFKCMPNLELVVLTLFYQVKFGLELELEMLNKRKAGTNLCMHQHIKPNQHKVATDRCNRLCAVVVRCGCHVPWLYP